MKKTFISALIAVFAVISLISCSTNLENRITFQNLASNAVYINFRANLVKVNPNETTNLTELPKGIYTYETTYEVPAGTESTTAEGEVSGQVEIKAGTKILIVYSSVFSNGTYTLFATKTSSDDQTVEPDPNPIGP